MTISLKLLSNSTTTCFIWGTSLKMRSGLRQRNTNNTWLPCSANKFNFWQFAIVGSLDKTLPSNSEVAGIALRCFFTVCPWKRHSRTPFSLIARLAKEMHCACITGNSKASLNITLLPISSQELFCSHKTSNSLATHYSGKNPAFCNFIKTTCSSKALIRIFLFKFRKKNFAILTFWI